LIHELFYSSFFLTESAILEATPMHKREAVVPETKVATLNLPETNGPITKAANTIQQ